MMLTLGDVIGGGGPGPLVTPFTPPDSGSPFTVMPVLSPFGPTTQETVASRAAFLAASVPPAYPGGPWRTPEQAAADAVAQAAAPGAGAYQEAYKAAIAAGATEAGAQLAAANAGNAAASQPAAGTANGSQQANTEPGFLSQYGIPLAIAGGIGALLLLKK